MANLSKREQAYYDKLPASLTHKVKMMWMGYWATKFNFLHPRTQQRIAKQAYADAQSQYVVEHNGKLISVPQENVLKTLERLGYEIKAELILVK